jgi:putative tricarboxylic transport membrane protein
VLTPIVVFFFFEATLKILLPKGITEPFFFPLYAMFF